MATSFKQLEQEIQIGEKIVKISPLDPEIICFSAIIKRRKKLTQAKYIVDKFAKRAKQSY